MPLTPQSAQTSKFPGQPFTAKTMYNIIWGAMMGAIVMYLVVAEYFVGQAPGGARPISILAICLCAFAGAGLVAGLILIKVMITPEKIVKQKTAENANSYLIAIGIQAMAFIESAAIFGLILFFLRFPAYLTYACMGASFAAMGLSRVMVEPAWNAARDNPRWRMK